MYNTVKKYCCQVVAIGLLYNCTTQKDILSSESGAFKKAYESISKENIKKNLYVIAADNMEGRDTGSEGQKRAGKYIISHYQTLAINHPSNLSDYYQKVPAEFMNAQKGEHLNDSENILAYIEGTEKPNEFIVVSAHYDHVGIKNGVVYNGADDDGSGTVSVMEIAKAFQIAKKTGNGPKRSILFLHFTGEEHGLFGSAYYTKNPVFPLENTVADLNIDMIGRSDASHQGMQYVYVIGSDMLSSQLKKVNEESNNKTNNLILDYKYDDPKDPQRLYYRSDHYNFAKHNIPVAFFFDGLHEDYHKSTDDPEKIDYDLITKRTQLIFTTAWQLANQPDKIVVDKK